MCTGTLGTYLVEGKAVASLNQLVSQTIEGTGIDLSMVIPTSSEHVESSLR